MLSVEGTIGAIRKEIADREARRSLLLSEIETLDREIADRLAALRAVGEVIAASALPVGPVRVQATRRPSQRTAIHRRLEAAHPRGETARGLLAYLRANGYPGLTLNALSSALSYSKKAGAVRHEGLLFFRAPPKEEMIA